MKQKQVKAITLKEAVLWLQAPSIACRYNANRVLKLIKQTFTKSGNELRVYQNNACVPTIYEVIITQKRIIVRTQRKYTRSIKRDIAGADKIKL